MNNGGKDKKPFSSAYGNSLTTRTPWVIFIYSLNISHSVLIAKVNGTVLIYSIIFQLAYGIKIETCQAESPIGCI